MYVLRDRGGNDGEQLTKSVHVVVVELEVEELSVALNAVLGQTLGENDVAVLETPSQEHPEMFRSVILCNVIEIERKSVKSVQQLPVEAVGGQLKARGDTHWAGVLPCLVAIALISGRSRAWPWAIGE